MSYSRQDRKVKAREPITAKLVANLISVAGANRLVTIDFHADQLQGFYDIPVDHFPGYPIFADYIKSNIKNNYVVVSPDMGGVKRANKLADLLNCSIAVLDKVRPDHNKAEISTIVGDVKNKTAIVLDDMIDTGGSITAATFELKKRGAKNIVICATHGLLSNNALELLEKSDASKVLLLDTLPTNIKSKKIKVLSIAPLLAKGIYRIHKNLSLGELFNWEKV